MNGDDPKLDELDKLLNDPEVPMQASRIWELLDEISGELEPSGYHWPVALPAERVARSERVVDAS